MKRWFSRLKPGSGFTLIELLVVVAVIALLFALILPAAYRMREVARSAQCTSNLRQLYTAAMNYSTTRQARDRGRLPYAASHLRWSDTTERWHKRTGWVDWISRDNRTTRETRWWGEDATNSIARGTLFNALDRNKEVYVCPTFKMKYTRGGEEAFRSYVMSRRMSDANLFSLTGASSKVMFADGRYDRNDDDGERIAYNDMQGPEDWDDYGLTGGDSRQRDDSSGGGDDVYGPPGIDGMLDGHEWQAGQPYEAIGGDHAGLGNVVFADGHTERLDHTYTVDIFEGRYEP